LLSVAQNEHYHKIQLWYLRTPTLTRYFCINLSRTALHWDIYFTVVTGDMIICN